MRAPCLHASVLAFYVLGALGAVSMHGQQHTQPLRAFIPHWMAESKLSHGMLHWDNELPPRESYGQDDEDITAEAHYFHNLHNGTFLELGALDGNTFSNTRYYEEQRGWRGVLIEPNREEFEKIPITRPHAIAVNAAICEHSQDVHFISKRTDQQTTVSAGRRSALCQRFAGKTLHALHPRTSPLMAFNQGVCTLQEWSEAYG